jgi:hypothetical protein
MILFLSILYFKGPKRRKQTVARDPEKPDFPLFLLPREKN